VFVEGKQFACEGARFTFHGVTYGTFAARPDGALFPGTNRLRRDLAAISAAGFNVIRTYTSPPDDLLDAASEYGLKVLSGLFYRDWRYLLGTRSGEQRRLAAQARAEARQLALRLAENPTVLAICVGNEIPADVVRWVGGKVVSRLIGELADIVHEVDPQQLVTYANYPSTEYLHVPNLDFTTFNVFLENRAEMRRYLTRIQHLANDLPLVIGETGLSANGTSDGDARQAEVLEWQLETALERGVAGTCIFSWTDDWSVGGQAVRGWHFGLTRSDRQPRPALAVAKRANRRSLRDLRDGWPSMSVVICAHNAESTLEECLRHTRALDYEPFEVIVVDDGSSDDTASIARKFDGVRVLSIEHGGLAAARNEGLHAATGEIVAYLDSDAYPSAEWLLYLALGFDRPDVVGVGGPSTAAPDDGLGSHQVAAAPGGPVHVLLGDDRAEHIPGCNMAFRKSILEQIGGFDPVFRVAGDDVDVCWRIIDRGWHIGFHPAAQVWHHRRPGIGAYLRQQLGYGRSEALVEARHPYRFTRTGTARWRGRIYQPVPNRVGSQKIFRGIYGTAGYQSVYGGGGRTIDFAHQVGVPIAVLCLLTAPLALVVLPFGVLPLSAVAFLLALGAIDFGAAAPPPSIRSQRLSYRFGVALMHLLQPLSRTFARSWHRPEARKRVIRAPQLIGPAQALSGGVVLIPEDRPREKLVDDILLLLRQAGVTVVPPTGWEPYDARLLMTVLVAGELITSSHPVGWVQVRIVSRLRMGAVVGLACAAALLGLIAPAATVGLLLIGMLDLMIGASRLARLRARIRSKATG
jgi:glycosyltransferase involved in cell wall biosynthesis/exo-beta-1,3-glucanase (GH17 family)